MVRQNTTTTEPNDELHSMKIGVVSDYHMDPEKAEETGEDPVDTVLFPEDRDYDEFPFRVLETVEMRFLHGKNRPENLPSVDDGETTFGTVYWTDEDGFQRFEWADEFQPDADDDEEDEISEGDEVRYVSRVDGEEHVGTVVQNDETGGYVMVARSDDEDYRELTDTENVEEVL